MRLKTKMGLTGFAATALMAAGSASAFTVIGVNTWDGAAYTISYEAPVSGSTYKFRYVADFTGYSGNWGGGTDYAMAFSIASQPGNVDWAAGAITAAPGTIGLWSIQEGVVTNSNGCPIGTGDSKDWCIGLNSSNLGTNPLLVAGSSVLTWDFTMTLTGGTPILPITQRGRISS